MAKLRAVEDTNLVHESLLHDIDTLDFLCSFLRKSGLTKFLRVLWRVKSTPDPDTFEKYRDTSPI